MSISRCTKKLRLEWRKKGLINCGHCHWFNYVERSNYGDCWLLPPTTTNDSNYKRPTVLMYYQACSKYKRIED